MANLRSATTELDAQPQQSHTDESPQRHATLKKKNSVKRSASKRSKADTLGSTTLSPTSNNDEPRNDITRSPLWCPVPTNADPTVVLAARFQAWRSVIKEFINYFKSVSSIEDARSRNLAKLNNSLTVPFRENGANEFFIEAGGVQDIGHALKARAKTMVTLTSDFSRKILTNIVPPLEKLRSDLHLKIKEIKGLSGDFKNSVPKEQDLTRRQLQALSESITTSSERPGEISPKHDPHLAKMAFERQLRHHLQEENFLHQAYRNIESSGRALEGLVVKILREAFTHYQEMLSAEASATAEFAATMGRVGSDLPVDKEWDSFIADAKDLVDPKIPIRTFKDIDYPGAHQVTLIRQGRLERKSKYLKSYSSAFYILTAVGYFHEFKSSHMQDLQVSLFLPSCTLGGHSSPSDRSHKFVLKGSQSGGMGSRHNWVFRAETHEEMLAWYQDIEQLVQLPNMSLSQRQTFIASHAPEDTGDHQRQSGSSSPGLDEDEADEVPYSQSHSIEEPSQRSPQRPAPGGSFPSETRLEDTAMYDSGRHSRAASDVTSELHPTTLSRDEDMAAVFGSNHDLERPFTSTTDGSIGDDRDFSTAAIGTGVGAATTGGLIYANEHRDRQIDFNDPDIASKQTATPHEAAQYYAGTPPLTTQGNDFSTSQRQVEPLPAAAFYTTSGDSSPNVNDLSAKQRQAEQSAEHYASTTESQRQAERTAEQYSNQSLPHQFSPVPHTPDSRLQDFALVGLAGGAGVGALAYSQRSTEPNPESETPRKQAAKTGASPNSEIKNPNLSAAQTGTGIETKQPTELDSVPAELNSTRYTGTQLGSRSAPSTSSGNGESLAPPTNTIRRSKSKKEIVEETIAESIGNHPERGMIPGFWPETPAEEKREFR